MSPYIKTRNGKIAELLISVLIVKQGDYFVAYCPSLNLSSYGKSVKDAKKGFDETLTDYFAYAIENNSLHADLTGQGWTFIQDKINPPMQIDMNMPAGIILQQFTENRKVALC